MSAPSELQPISSSERIELFSREPSCNLHKEVFAGLHANGEDDDSSSHSSGTRIGELILPNGDIYSGTLLGNTPEGSGRYLWSDGCVYEGEWKRGRRHGHGKTLWPSGATYEGDYSGGFIYGEGTYTYTAPDGSTTYKGQWKLNCKHGLGFQTYPNGDMVQGSWIHGQIQGHGCYSWANGNTYAGNMTNGKMSGKGILSWSNGDTYDGNWLDAMMHGYGVYTWKDSGCYVGTWTRGLKDGKGTFYPEGCRIPVTDELHINALRKRGVLPDILNHTSYMKANGELSQESAGASSKRSFSFQQPRSKKVLQRRWSLEVAIEKFMGNAAASEAASGMADSRFPILEREYMQGVLISEVALNRSLSESSKKAKRQQRKLVKDIKRPGETIIKGHRSYDLMLSLQLGIRYTVGKITPIQSRQVRASDFGPRASFWMNFPKQGSRLTPSHYAVDFKWKDYCPMVFRNLREMFKIDAADYMISICGSAALRELSSPGKSGSIFFLSQDDRFMIKTLRKSEVQVLLRMLPNYYHHVRTYENTLITKFFGLHRVKPSSGQKFRFVVMGNMFCTELRIHRRFDLKGSSLGRSADKIEIDENTTLKDLDLNYSFYLEPSWRETLLNQIKIDSEFLRSEHIMDYSLLLGVHYRAPQHLRTRRASTSNHHRSTSAADRFTVLSEQDDAEEDASWNSEGLVLVERGGSKENSMQGVVGPHIRGRRLRASPSSAGVEEVDVDLLLPGIARLQIQLGVNMPARAESCMQVYDVVLYLGIIDILQEYDIGKRMEHAYKSIKYDSISISAIHPRFYSDRFLKFIQKIFPQNPQELV